MRAVTIRRILVPLSAAALLCAAAGCGDGGDEVAGPTATPTVAASTPASPTPTVSAEATTSPAVPDVPKPDPADYPGMDQHTDEGAAQAYRYYMAVLVWSYQTGDVSELGSLGADSCESCRQNLDAIAKNATGGDLWGPSVITDVELEAVASPKNDFEIIYNFVVDETRESSGEGPAATSISYMSVGALNWMDGAWLVTDFILDVESA